MSVASITEKDRKDLEFIMKHDFDWVALSFVREAKDIFELKDILKKNNCEAHVVAKIEKPQAVANIDSILSATDAVMVARGDLGVEMPPEAVPIIQKNIVDVVV